MRHVAMVALLALMVLAVALPAHALTTTHIESFSGELDMIGVTPFDPALGTLDRVFVSISGQLIVNGVTGQNLLPVGPSGALQPQPYSYLLEVRQSFAGLANRYFEFSAPARFFLPGAPSGGGEPLSFVSQFGYDFKFDAMSDLIGFTFPLPSGAVIPPPAVAGVRADFIEELSSIDTIELRHEFTLSGQPPPVTTPTMITSLTSVGFLQITYEYTPVPEPATLLLLGLGLAPAVIARRRR